MSKPSRTVTDSRRGISRIAAAAVAFLAPELLFAAVVTAGAFRVPPPPPAPVTSSVPVLLVPGWYDEAADLLPLTERLVRAGWSREHVLPVSFDDPVGSNEDHAREIAARVDELFRRTGAPQIDIVAHSMGGLAVRTFLADSARAEQARRVVFLGTPQRGTWLAYFAWGRGGEEMVPESEFLERLNRQPPVPPGVAALTIRTPVDTRVVPGASATLPGVPDVEVCCPTHRGLVDDDQTFTVVHAFLAEGRRIDPDPLLR